MNRKFYLYFIVLISLLLLKWSIGDKSEIRLYHEELLETISNQVRNRPIGSSLVLKRSPAQGHCPRPHTYKQGKQTIQVDISGLSGLLSIEELAISDLPNHLRHLEGIALLNNANKCLVAEVGAMTSMEQLVDDLLPHGYIPAIVPEFKGITVGGSIQGLAAESSSFKFGLFHDTVLEIQAILSNGSIVTCNPISHSDLFYSLPGSFGSLGICTSAKVLCIPSSRYVQVSAIKHNSKKDAIAFLERELQRSLVSDGSESRKAPDFIEAIGYSEDELLSVTAQFISSSYSDCNSNVVRRCLGWGRRWFYKLVRAEAMDLAAKAVISGEEAEPPQAEFLLPIKDYLFRHDRGSFWMASYRIPECVGRYMDPVLDSTNMFKLATTLPWAFPKKCIVLQDFMVPFDEVSRFIDGLQNHVPLWPIWLLPMRNIHVTKVDSGSDKQDRAIFGFAEDVSCHFCNVGAYGIPRKKKKHSDSKAPLRYQFESDNRQLESLLHDHRGRKVYYSHAFYEKEFFYKTLYDGSRYFEMRNKYCPDAGLPEIYDKIITKNGKL